MQVHNTSSLHTQFWRNWQKKGGDTYVQKNDKNRYNGNYNGFRNYS